MKPHGDLESTSWLRFSDTQISNPPSETSTIVPKLDDILNDISKRRELYMCRGDAAQILLDLFQSILDTPELNPLFRRKLLFATRRLSKKAGLYPKCYDLPGVVQDGERPVASGGFADIYKGIFRGQSVCLKVVRLYQQSDQEHFLKVVSKEAIVWRQLEHRNVLPMYGIFWFNSQISFVSPWMEAGNLVQYLENNETRAPRRLLGSAMDTAQGLQHLHQNGVIHGDLKGLNVLVNDDGVACLTDFGLSSISDSKLLSWTPQSSSIGNGGTIPWQAPELFDEAEDSNKVNNTMATDIYAWSCVCYEVFTGKKPFMDTPNQYSIILRVKNGQRPLPPVVGGPSWTDWGLTENIWSIIEAGWSQNPLDRPTIEDIVARLILELGQDNRADTNILPSIRFRQEMRQPVDVTKVSPILDSFTLASIEKVLTAEDRPSHQLAVSEFGDENGETTYGMIDEAKNTGWSPCGTPKIDNINKAKGEDGIRLPKLTLGQKVRAPPMCSASTPPHLHTGLIESRRDAAPPHLKIDTASNRTKLWPGKLIVQAIDTVVMRDAGASGRRTLLLNDAIGIPAKRDNTNDTHTKTIRLYPTSRPSSHANFVDTPEFSMARSGKFISRGDDTANLIKGSEKSALFDHTISRPIASTSASTSGSHIQTTRPFPPSQFGPMHFADTPVFDVTHQSQVPPHRPAFYISTKNSKTTWKKEINEGDLFVDNPQPGDLVILLMGPSGSGKSTFINTLLGKNVTSFDHIPQSQTPRIHHYIIPDPHHRIFIVEIPGFRGTFNGDHEILRRIAVWLAHSYSTNMRLVGIIYLHEVTQAYAKFGISRLNFDMFTKLCGMKAMVNVTLATTKWSDTTAEGMLLADSTMCRFDCTQSSAQGIVKDILSRKPLDAIQIQLELAVLDKALAETEAGCTLRGSLVQSLQAQRKMAAQLQKEDRDDASEHVIETGNKIRLIHNQINALSVPFSRKLGPTRHWLPGW